MPGGVVFLVCIPTLSYEHELVFGIPVKLTKKNEKVIKKGTKVDLRLKEMRNKNQLITIGDDDDDDDAGHQDLGEVDEDEACNAIKRPRPRGLQAPATSRSNRDPVFVPMETVL